jgi:mitochondrial fission protein ELM1
MKMTRQKVRVVIATDGKRGHENQSRVLARMLGDSEPLIMRLRNPEGGWGETLLRAAFALRGEWRMPVRSAGERVRELLRPKDTAEFRDFSQAVGKQRADYRIFTVSTGTPPATGSLLLSKLFAAEPLCVMTPSLLPRRLFTLQIVPTHDTAGKTLPANVLPHPLALSYFDQSAAEFQAVQLRSQLGLKKGEKLWGLAIGGPSKSVIWTQPVFESQLRKFVAQASAAGARLLVTTSRRTPPEATEFARRECAPHCAFFLDASVDRSNPLPAFYELCEAMAVTADSFSMVCEAVQAGFKPYLIQPQRIGDKLFRGLSGLVDLQLIELDSRANEGLRAVQAGRGEPNRFYNDLRAEVRSRLGLD